MGDKPVNRMKSKGLCLPLITYLFISVALLQLGACSPCAANTALRNFHKQQLALSSLTSSPNSPVMGYNFNYPIQLLASAQSSNINSIVTIHEYGWIGKQRKIDYVVKADHSVTSLLVEVQTKDMEWSLLKVVIMVNDRGMREGLYFGGVKLEGQTEATVDVPNWRPDSKYFSFITGISAELNSPNNFLYDISISHNSPITIPSKLTLSVQSSSTTTLHKIFISFISYSASINPNDFTSHIGTLQLKQGKVGQHFFSLDEKLITMEHLLFGMRAVKIKVGFEKVEIAIGARQGFVGEIGIGQFVQELQVGYFGVSVQGVNVCGRCYGSFISPSIPTACASICQGAVKLVQANQFSQCIPCSSQLNLQYSSSSNSCQCKQGYSKPPALTSSPLQKCYSQSQLLSFTTSSLQQGDCLGSHMVRNNQNQCVCTSQYYLNANSKTCVRRCPLGIWRDNYCDQCQAGSYPWDQQMVCKKCMPQCRECASEFACKFCADNFYQSEGKCIEICGDGRRITFQCDDGNQVSGDGCDSECKKQLGYICVGGSASTRDQCNMPLTNLTLSKISISTSGFLQTTLSIQSTINQQYSNSQLKEIFKVETKYDGFELFISQDEQNFNQFQMIYDFHSILPLEDLEIKVTYLMSQPQASVTFTPGFMKDAFKEDERLGKINE